jgi:hypothetical protein
LEDKRTLNNSYEMLKKCFVLLQRYMDHIPKSVTSKNRRSGYRHSSGYKYIKFFFYNERKAKEGKAIFYHNRNTPSVSPFVYSAQHSHQIFKRIEDSNTKVSNKDFISLLIQL